MNTADHIATATVAARTRRLAFRLLTFVMLIAPAIATAGSPEPFPAGDDFGAGLTLREATPLSDVVAHPERFEGKPVLVRGRISDVCQMKGCWTVLTDGTVSMRVRFHDYGFFLPTGSIRRNAIVEGLVKEETLSEETARHYASESASNDEEPGEIHGAQRVVGFTATGVRLVAKK